MCELFVAKLKELGLDTSSLDSRACEQVVPWWQLMQVCLADFLSGLAVGDLKQKRTATSRTNRRCLRLSLKVWSCDTVSCLPLL